MKIPAISVDAYGTLEHQRIPLYISRKLDLLQQDRQKLQMSKRSYIPEVEKLSKLLINYIEAEKSTLKK